MEMTPPPSPALFSNDARAEKILNMKDADYRAFKAVSKSGLDWMDVSPAHYKNAVIDGNQPEPTAAMQLGSAFDSLLLTPELFREEWAVAPNVRRGTKAWDEFEQANQGKRLLKQDEFDQLQGMRESVMRHKVARGIFSLGDSQVSYKWQDPITGVICKSRADFVRADGVMVDLKTTLEGGAKPDAFSKTAFNFRYHAQAAFYSDGAAQVDEAPPTAFIFVVVERVAPYAVSTFFCDEDVLAAGRAAYQRNLEQYALAWAENLWPAYPEDIQRLALPAWAKA